MEIALLSGLALLGYELSKNGKNPRVNVAHKQALQRPNRYPIQDDKVIQQPVYKQPQPFFKSAKSQNTKESVKQQQMETFTGSDNVGWQHKREVTNMFAPTKDLAHINGAPTSMSADNRTERYTVTDKMHGVAPIEKQHIGPGLNLESHESAKGGFHDTFRILPDNVEGYKKNNLPGRIVPGKGVTAQRDALPTVQDNLKPERYYALDDRPSAPSRSQYSAQAPRGKYDMQSTLRGNCNDFVGIVGNSSKGFEDRGNSTRSYDSTACTGQGNPHKQVAGTGAYAGDTQYVVPNGERESCGDVSNANLAGHGQSTYFSQGARPTMREDKNTFEGHAHNSALTASGNITSYYANPTGRETQNEHIVGPKYGISGSSTRDYMANPTQRESVQSDYTGPASSAHKGSASQYSMRSADPYHKRESAQIEHTPNGGRMNLRSDAHDAVGHTEFTSDCHSQPFTHGKGPNKIKDTQQQGSIEHVSKLPVANLRNDFSIAHSQLHNNPYSQSVS